MSLSEFTFEQLDQEYLRRLEFFGRGKILINHISRAKWETNKLALEKTCQACGNGTLKLRDTGIRVSINMYGKKTAEYYLTCDKCIYSFVHCDHDN